MKTFLKILLIIFLCASCKPETLRNEQESVLDSISHVEDSVYYRFDSLPRLCEVLKMDGQFVDIGDCNLYCETEGKGTPMVLINGGPGGTHHYFHPWFSRAAKYSRVIYYDQRGCGQSDFSPGDEGYTFEQAVNDLDLLRQKLGIDKWIVCGYSYGGALAQFYTATHPENVLGMVLISALPLIHDAAFSGSREQDFISDEENQKIRELYTLYRGGQLTLEQLLYNKELNGDWKRQSFYKPSPDETVRAALYEWVNDKGFNRSVMTTLSRYDFVNVFDSCPVPVLLCEGEWDLTWQAEKKDVFRESIPGAEYVLFEHSGHPIYYDEADLFFQILKDFVMNLKPADREEISQWKGQTEKLIGVQQDLFKREAVFFEMIRKGGVESAREYYRSFKEENNDKALFSETGMNSFGYSFLQENDVKTAIRLFEMNVEEYPDSWNVYDSLAEAFLAAGNKEKAIENYRKSLELNQGNTNGRKVLEGLI